MWSKQCKRQFQDLSLSLPKMTNQIYLSVALSAAYCTKWSQNTKLSVPCVDRRRAKSSARLSLKCIIFVFVRLGPTQESLSDATAGG
jgi:hypothetical protein